MDEKKDLLPEANALEAEKTPETQTALAVTKPGAYSSKWTQQLNDSMDKILNRKNFSYDVNGDALYQQYKDRYIQGGQMAMMDTMGQAATLTGGYGNSYAQMAGQQAYQGYLQGLNDKIPELYQLALDKYDREGDAMYKQYAMLGAQEGQDYERYQQGLNQYQQEWENAFRLYQMGVTTPEVLGILGIPELAGEDDDYGGGDYGGGGGSGFGGGSGDDNPGEDPPPEINIAKIRSEYLNKNNGISQADKDAILISAVKNQVITGKDAYHIQNAAKDSGRKNTGSYSKVGGKYPYNQDR